jgi:hypothetical protein
VVGFGGLQKLTLPPGTNYVRVESPGFKSFTTKVVVEAGGNETLPVTMVAVGDKHVSHAVTPKPGAPKPATPTPTPEKGPTNPNMINPF